MDFFRKYPIFRDLLKPFRRSQQKTCAAIVSALCQVSQASSFSIAGQLSCLSEVQLGSLSLCVEGLPPPKIRLFKWLIVKQN